MEEESAWKPAEAAPMILQPWEVPSGRPTPSIVRRSPPEGRREPDPHPLARMENHMFDPVEGCCQPVDNRIHVRRCEISKARNNGPGEAITDWTQAEREVAARRDAKS